MAITLIASLHNHGILSLCQLSLDRRSAILRSQTTTLRMAADSDSEQLPFLRNLASSDRKLRTRSLESLHTHLTALASLSAPAAQKLWTGLFFALWMTDRPLPQQRLAQDLADLVFALRPACVDPWMRGFWAVVGARWTDVDVLRLEKFLLLVRRVFAAQVGYAKKHGFRSGEATGVLDVWREWPLEAEGDLRRMPLGVRLHALDIWIDELEKQDVLTTTGGGGGGDGDEKEGADAEAAAAAAAFVRRVGDMVEELKRCPIKPVRERSAESLEDERLPWVRKQTEEDSDEQQDGEDEEWGGIQD